MNSLKKNILRASLVLSILCATQTSTAAVADLTAASDVTSGLQAVRGRLHATDTIIDSVNAMSVELAVQTGGTVRGTVDTLKGTAVTALNTKGLSLSTSVGTHTLSSLVGEISNIELTGITRTDAFTGLGIPEIQSGTPTDDYNAGIAVLVAGGGTTAGDYLGTDETTVGDAVDALNARLGNSSGNTTDGYNTLAQRLDAIDAILGGTAGTGVGETIYERLVAALAIVNPS